MLRDSPSGDTSNVSTVVLTDKWSFATYLIDTTHVLTFTVAALDVWPHGLLRNIKYRSSFTTGQSHCAADGSFSWFYI
jgi:hypothetical protein